MRPHVQSTDNGLAGPLSIRTLQSSSEPSVTRFKVEDPLRAIGAFTDLSKYGPGVELSVATVTNRPLTDLEKQRTEWDSKKRAICLPTRNRSVVSGIHEACPKYERVKLLPFIFFSFFLEGT